MGVKSIFYNVEICGSVTFPKNHIYTIDPKDKIIDPFYDFIQFFCEGVLSLETALSHPGRCGAVATRILDLLLADVGLI